MISPEVRKTLELISHSLDQNTLHTLSQRWRNAPREPGGLGPVESAALHYCMLRRCEPAPIATKGLYVVCAAQGLAAGAPGPSQQQRYSSLLAGSSPASVLARMTSTSIVAVNAALPGVWNDGAINLQLAESSPDPAAGPAMTVPQANEALEAGIVLAEDASNRFEATALACLDGRTNAAASALAAALMGSGADQWMYAEPSLDPSQAARRRDAVRAALVRHDASLATPFEALRLVSSIDLAVMAGFILGAACRRLPVVIDGFAAAVAALLARRLAPDCIDVCIFSHANPSAAHADLLALLSVTPMLGAGISEEGGYAAALALHHLDLSLRILECIVQPATVE